MLTIHPLPLLAAQTLMLKLTAAGIGVDARPSSEGTAVTLTVHADSETTHALLGDRQEPAFVLTMPHHSYSNEAGYGPDARDLQVHMNNQMTSISVKAPIKNFDGEICDDMHSLLAVERRDGAWYAYIYDPLTDEVVATVTVVDNSSGPSIKTYV